MKEEKQSSPQEEQVIEQTEGQTEQQEADTQSDKMSDAEEQELSSNIETLSPEEELLRLKDTHLRLMAEYDNYRRRTLKEKSDLILHGGEKVLLALLPVVDDLDIALSNIDKAEDIDALREGIKLIYSKFVDYLSKQGVKAIETDGVAFSEELHEAIATFPASSEEQKGAIIDCVKKGYKLGDKVLRHASVVVAQ